MSKIFCFNCQKDVEAQPRLFWKICPHCRHKLSANDDGLYLICDHCGANNPANARQCIKCAYGLNGYDGTELKLYIRKPWQIYLLNFLAVILFFFICVGALYLSFYFIFALLIIGMLGAIVAFIRSHLP